MEKFFEGDSKGKSFATVDEETSNFYFGGVCHDVFGDGGDGEYCSGPLSKCGLLELALLPRKKRPPTRLRAFDSER